MPWKNIVLIELPLNWLLSMKTGGDWFHLAMLYQTQIISSETTLEKNCGSDRYG